MNHKRFTGFYFLIVGLVGLGVVIWSMVPDDCPSFYLNLRLQPIQELSDQNFSLMDVFPLDVDGDGLTDVLTTGYDPAGLPTPLRAFLNGGDGTFRDASTQLFGDLKFEHARHIAAGDLNGDGRVDLVVADHGVDRSPYPGGFTQLLLSQADGRYKAASTKDFPAPRAFTFHTVIVDWNGDGFKDVLLNNIPEPGPGPILLLNDGKARFSSHNELLPERLQAPACFMSSQAVDLDGDGRDELLLGGCDRLPKKPHEKYDLVLKFREGRYEIEPASTLPIRQMYKGWGTAATQVSDLDHDGRMDLVQALHNFGATQADVRLLWNRSSARRLSVRDSMWKFPLPRSELPDGFIPWVQTGDLNGDQLPELSFVIRPKSKVWIFENRRGHFKDRSRCVPQPEFIPAASLFLDLDRDQKAELVVFSALGTYRYYSTRN